MSQEIEHSYMLIRGLKLHIAHTGKGEIGNVLFVHGFPEVWYSWRHQMVAAVAAGFRAIAPDLPGYGLSEPPNDLVQASWEGLMKDLLAILDSFSISKVFLVAKDFGVKPAHQPTATVTATTMKAILALCVLFVGAFCAPVDDKLGNAWSLFKRVHQKQYNSVEDESARRNIWEANLAKIRQHNLEADIGIHTYTLGMNRFGDMTHEEFVQQMNGFKVTERSTEFDRHAFLAPSNIAIPDAVDWRKEGYVTPIKDQGQCGSCWAFSATGSLEGQHYAKTKQLVSLSEQNLVDCSGKFGNMGCDGGLMDSAFQYIKANQGIDTESSYPYEARDGKCRFKKENVGATDTGFVDIKAKNETDLQLAIATVGPISVAIDASQDSFQFYQSGVYNEAACSTTELDHGVLAVGYDKTANNQEYYIVKNSWGTSWGNKGYIWMSRNKKNQCGIATMASYPLV